MQGDLSLAMLMEVIDLQIRCVAVSKLRAGVYCVCLDGEGRGKQVTEGVFSSYVYGRKQEVGSGIYAQTDVD